MAGVDVARLQDAQRGDELLLGEAAAAAVVGEGGEALDHRDRAAVVAVVRLHAPDRQHRLPVDAVAGLDRGEGVVELRPLLARPVSIRVGEAALSRYSQIGLVNSACLPSRRTTSALTPTPPEGGVEDLAAGCPAPAPRLRKPSRQAVKLAGCGLGAARAIGGSLFSSGAPAQPLASEREQQRDEGDLVQGLPPARVAGFSRELAPGRPGKERSRMACAMPAGRTAGRRSRGCGLSRWRSSRTGRRRRSRRPRGCSRRARRATSSRTSPPRIVEAGAVGWPSMAAPSAPPMVQSPQVSRRGGAVGQRAGQDVVAVGRVATAVDDVALLVEGGGLGEALASPCSEATSSAIFSPLALYQGPLPMRSRAFSAAVER